MAYYCYYYNYTGEGGRFFFFDCSNSFFLLLVKSVGSARLRESDIHPFSPKTAVRQYHPIDGKKRKGKII